MVHQPVLTGKLPGNANLIFLLWEKMHWNKDEFKERYFLSLCLCLGNIVPLNGTEALHSMQRKHTLLLIVDMIVKCIFLPFSPLQTVLRLMTWRRESSTWMMTSPTVSTETCVALCLRRTNSSSPSSCVSAFSKDSEYMLLLLFCLFLFHKF